MAIIDLPQLLQKSPRERMELNLEVGRVWDSQPCGMEVVDGEDQLRKIDELMKLRQVDCPEIYRRIDETDFAGKAVLELGCGTGIDSRELIARGARLTSVDYSKRSCDLAAELLSVVFPGKPLNIIHASSHATGLADESFDFVYSHGSIHHSSLFPEICQEINRLLKPGGKALIMVYRKPSLMYRHARQGRLIDYNAPVSLFVSDAEFRQQMAPLEETWRLNYYFARPHVTRLGRFIPGALERIIGRRLGACQLVEFSKQ